MGHKTNILVRSEFLVGSLPRNLVSFGYFFYISIRLSTGPISPYPPVRYLVLENRLDTKISDPSFKYFPVNDSE